MSAHNPRSGDSDPRRVSRRTVLRNSALGASVALTATTALTSPAAASHDRDDGPEWDIPVKGGVRMKRHTEYPEIPGYTYVTSLHADDLCYWTGSACLYGGIASSRWTGLWGLIFGMGCKTVQAGGCRLKDDISRLAPYHFEWVYVYVATGYVWIERPEFILFPVPVPDHD